MINNNKIIKPIFAIGAPRSGTTILLKTIGMHKNIASLHNVDIAIKYFKLTKGTNFRKYYILSELIFVLNPYLTIFLNKLFNTKLVPVEGNIIFEILFMNSKYFIHTEQECNTWRDKFIKNILFINMKALNKNRIFLKDPMHVTQSFRFLNKLFPDAYFLNIVRDGRAVTNSLLNFHAFPFNRKWYFEGATNDELNLINRYPFLEAARVWKKCVQESIKCKKIAGDRYIELRYEDFVTKPIETLKNTLNDLELVWYPNFENQLKAIDLNNFNDKWIKYLPKDNLMIIEKYLEPELNILKYVY